MQKKTPSKTDQIKEQKTQINYLIGFIQHTQKSNEEVFDMTMDLVKETLGDDVLFNTFKRDLSERLQEKVAEARRKKDKESVIIT